MIIVTDFGRQPADGGGYFLPAKEDVESGLRIHIYLRL